MPANFRPVVRPDPFVIDTTLDTELDKAADDANLTLYFINIVVISASNLRNEDIGFDKSDPYCVVTVGGISDRTEKIQNNLNPVWDEKMSFFIPKKPDVVTFEVFDDDSKNIGIGARDDSLGVAKLEISELFVTGDSYEGELKLENDKKGSISVKLRCRVMMPIETEIKLGFAEMQLEGRERSMNLPLSL